MPSSSSRLKPAPDGVGAGWKLFAAWAREMLPPARRRLAWSILSGGSVAGSVLASLALDIGGRPFGVENVLLSLSGGIAASSLAVAICVGGWTRSRSSRRVPGEFAGVTIAYGTTFKIRTAWLSDREPEVTIEQRLAAAVAASRSRQVVPVILVWNVCLIPFWLAGIAGAITTQVSESLELPTLLLLPVYAVMNIGSTIGFLHNLGRTRAPIETAPAVPDHLQADGRKRPVPRKMLGTDHPDDYT